MKSILTLAAFGGLAYGARHFLKFMNEKSKNRLEEKKLEIWEGEGGAVPVEQTRAAGQVRPSKRPSASPGDVS